MHDGTTDFLKWCLWIGATFAAVMWISSIVGGKVTLYILGAIVLVIVFAMGALFMHTNQKMTLDAFNKANAQDAQIDKYRMQSFKAMAGGESAMQRAAAQLQVLDAKRVTTLAQQQAKLLTDAERERMDAEYSKQTKADVWTADDMDEAFGGW